MSEHVEAVGAVGRIGAPNKVSVEKLAQRTAQVGGIHTGVEYELRGWLLSAVERLKDSASILAAHHEGEGVLLHTPGKRIVAFLTLYYHPSYQKPY